MAASQAQEMGSVERMILFLDTLAGSQTVSPYTRAWARSVLNDIIDED
jgi:hypothetical protein